MTFSGPDNLSAANFPLAKTVFFCKSSNPY
jgi:hypothetical protein